jgi:hypothetical protein
MCELFLKLIQFNTNNHKIDLMNSNDFDMSRKVTSNHEYYEIQILGKINKNAQ